MDVKGTADGASLNSLCVLDHDLQHLLGIIIKLQELGISSGFMDVEPDYDAGKDANQNLFYDERLLDAVRIFRKILLEE